MSEITTRVKESLFETLTSRIDKPEKKTIKIKYFKKKKSEILGLIQRLMKDM